MGDGSDQRGRLVVVSFRVSTAPSIGTLGRLTSSSGGNRNLHFAVPLTHALAHTILVRGRSAASDLTHSSHQLRIDGARWCWGGKAGTLNQVKFVKTQVPRAARDTRRAHHTARPPAAAGTHPKPPSGGQHPKAAPAPTPYLTLIKFWNLKEGTPNEIVIANSVPSPKNVRAARERAGSRLTSLESARGRDRTSLMMAVSS